MGMLVGYFPLIVTGLAFCAAALACAEKFFRPRWITEDPLLHENFDGGAVWLAVRIFAFPTALFVWFGSARYIGTAGAVGQFAASASLMVNHVAPRLIVLAFLLGIFAPLIMNFGLVQFIAVYASPVMRPLFRIPGRSAVDCVASWLGSSSMAVVFTARMYDAGFYTAKEAASIICSFSLAGIYNIYAIAELFDMENAFLKILAVVYSSMIALAVVMPRIWPLSAMSDSYYKGRDNYRPHCVEDRHGRTLFQLALLRGASRARHATLRTYAHESLTIIYSLLLGTVPLMITFGTLSVLIAEGAGLTSLLAAPLAALLSAAGAVEGRIIASAAVFSFVDQFLAVTYGRLLLLEQSRFICICLTVIGLVNITEVGLHVWHSNIPLRLWQMAAVYVIRIVLSIGIVVPAAQLLFP